MRKVTNSAAVAMLGVCAACGESGSSTAPAGVTAHSAYASRASSAAPVAVTLAATADGPFTVRDVASGASVEVALRQATSAPAEAIEDRVVYRRAFNGGDVTQRRTLDGVEDFVAFAEAPAEPSVAYAVTVGEGIEGLRLVEQTLELLDARGTPRLRMRAPYIVGADGARAYATTRVEGCAVDTSPIAPWGRPTMPLGSRTCTVRVAWDNAGVRYPALLDPSWSITGSLAVPRYQHASSPLADGRVIVVGGDDLAPTGTPGHCSGTVTATAEIFDVPSGTWSTTGSLHHFQDLPASVLLSTGKVLVADTSTTYSESYDPSTGLFTAATNTPTVIHSIGALVALAPGNSGRALFIGGSGGGAPLAAVDLFDDATSTWSVRASLATARYAPGAALASNGNVVVAGGDGIASASVTAVESYDPAQDAWTTSANASPSFGYTKAARDTTGAHVLFTGASVSSRYDVATDSWTTAQTCPTSGILAPQQEQILNVRFDSSTASLYDFTLDSWKTTQAPVASPPADSFTLAPALGGSVVLAGGLLAEATGCASSSVTEIFAAPDLDGGADDAGAALDATTLSTDAGLDAGPDSATSSGGGRSDATVGDDAGPDDAGVTLDAGSAEDAAPTLDAGSTDDAGAAVDGGQPFDAGAIPDASLPADAGAPPDAAFPPASDAQAATDASTPTDAQAAPPEDASPPVAEDAATPPVSEDAASPATSEDAAAPSGDEDAASPGTQNSGSSDSGTTSGASGESSGCGCRVAGPRTGDHAWLALAVPFAALSARRRRRVTPRSSSRASHARRTSPP